MELNDTEVQHLAWIHSNKFTTPELFHGRFIFPKTYRHACAILRDNYFNRGLLGVTKAQSTTFQDSMYFLSPKAIRLLDQMDKILVKRTKYQIRINPYEREHDLQVQAIRSAFERNEQLGRIFWLSDFEMRAGITASVKKTFLKGELDKDRWRTTWTNLEANGRRTPDGYFETDLDGKRYGFTLEFEHVQNPEGKIGRMLEYLGESFPTALRLVVSATPENAARMTRILRSKISEKEWVRWFISDYEKAVSLPFKKIWLQLSNVKNE